MITPRFIVGFSGHRNLASPQVISPQIKQALEKLAQIAKDRHQGALEVFTSIAYGADLLMADAAMEQKLPLHIVIPKPVENHDETKQLPNDKGFAADFWAKLEDGTKDFREEDWKATLGHIVEARKGTYGGSLRLVRGAQTSPECYYDAGVQMVDVSDVIIAVWDGNDAKGLGGTADVVELARKRAMPLIWIHSATGEVMEERMEKFASADDGGCLILKRLEKHFTSCRSKIENADVQPPEAKFPLAIEDAYKALSGTANAMAGDFRNSLVKSILGHGTATAVAAVAAVLTEYQDKPWLKWALVTLAFVEFVLVFRAIKRQRRLHHGEVHEAWMDTRFASEIVRGLQDAGRLLDPLVPLIAKHHPQWRRFATGAALELYATCHTDQDWQAQRDDYVNNRLLGDKGQVLYFSDKQKEAELRFKKAARCGTFLGNLAVAFVLGALLYKGWKLVGAPPKDPWIKAFSIVAFTLLPILLPLAVSLALSLRNALDSGRRTYRYKEMAERLEEAAEQIKTLKSASSTRRAIAATEEILIDELNEWHLAEKQNEAH